MDLSVSLYNENLYTDLHIKATDCHQYLEYTSSNPEHTKKSIIYSQNLRLSWLCSFEQEFQGHKRNLRSWFVKRRYPEEIIDKEMSKVKFNFSNKINPKENEEKGVRLVVTFHPSLNYLSKIIRGNLHLLHMNDEVKKVFSPKTLISFRSARKLSSYIVRAKLYPIERTVGSFKCTKKRCEVCEKIHITDSFTSSVTQNTYKINHKLNCDDECLIYLMTCKQCWEQYGETTDAFRKR